MASLLNGSGNVDDYVEVILEVEVEMEIIMEK